MMKIKWSIVLGVFVALIFTQRGFAQYGDPDLNEIINSAQKTVQEANLLIQKLDEEANQKLLERGVSEADEQRYIDSAAMNWPRCDLSICDFSVCYFPEEMASSLAEKEKVDKVSMMLREKASIAIDSVQQELNAINQYRASPGGAARIAAFQMVSEAEVAKAATKTNQAVNSVFEFVIQGKIDIKTAVCRVEKSIECCSRLEYYEGKVRYLERLVKELDTEGYDDNGNLTYGSFETLALDAAAISNDAYQTSEKRAAQAKRLIRDTSEFSRVVDTAEMHSIVAGINASIASMYASRAKVIANVAKYMISAIKARDASPSLPDFIGEPGPGSSTSPGSNVPKKTAGEKESPLAVEADANLDRAKSFAADPFWDSIVNAKINVNKINELTKEGRALSEGERSMVSGFNWNGVSPSIKAVSQKTSEMEATASELAEASDSITAVKRQPSPIKPGTPQRAAAVVVPTTTAPTTTAPTTTAPTTTIAPTTTTTTTAAATTTTTAAATTTTTTAAATTTTTTAAATTTTITETTVPCASPPCP